MIADIDYLNSFFVKYVYFPTLNMVLLMTEREIENFKKTSKDCYMVFDYYPSKEELKKIKLNFLQKN